MGKTFQQSESENPSFGGVGEAITATYYIETPFAPEQAVFVSESGIRNNADMQMVRQLGADAVLIGETLMRSDDIAGTLHQLREGV